MTECKHIRIIIENRFKDEYGQIYKAHCSCGRISTNFHTDINKAKLAFWQNKNDS